MQEVVYAKAGRHELIDDWFNLLAYCDAKCRDPATWEAKLFKARSDAYARAWARLSVDDQGYVSMIIAARLQAPGA
jgi:hypothetical protein